MPQRASAVRTVLTAVVLVASAASAFAQVARVSGLVKDDLGQPIKGATIRAENPDAPLGSITAATDDKGRFAIIGLARGEWMFTADAPGFQAQFTELNIVRTGTPMPPLVFTLSKAVTRPPASVEGVTAKDMQQQLASGEALYKQQKYDEAIGVYRTILRNAPSMVIVNVQIAAAYRSLKDYDKALAAYGDLLKAEPDNQRAQVGLGETNLEKGDTPAAELALTKAAESPAAGRDVFFNLAEIKVARSQPDEAAKWYQKAAAADASWGKPVFKLGMIAMNKGDKDAATKAMTQVVAVDPTSAEATEARAVLERLK